jgi:diguanylate cyclase (GGDEF)-like protein
MAEPTLSQQSSSSRVFNWSTDLPAVLVIALGICIAIVLNDIALRLIGVCIAILGGVALFVLIGQRATSFAKAAPQPETDNEEFRIVEKAPHSATASPAAMSFGDDDDIPDATVNPFQAASQQASTPASESGHRAPEPASKATFTFDDDIDAEQDFSALEEKLSLAPDKYVPIERPSKAASESFEESPAFSQPTQPARKAVLSFDDDTETFVTHVDFQPTIPMEEARVTPIISPEAQQQSYSYLPSKEELNEPIPTPALKIGASFVDGDEEIRIVGKRKGDGLGDVEHPPLQDFASPKPTHKAIPQPKPTTIAETGVAARTEIGAKASAETNAEARLEMQEPPTAHISDRIRAAETFVKEQQTALPEQVIAHIPSDTFVGVASQASPLNTSKTDSASTHTRKTLSIQHSDIVDEESEAARKEPRKEFDYLLQRVLLLIRSAVSASTAGFVWVHFERNQFIAEMCLSDSEAIIQKNHILPFGVDTSGAATDALTAITQTNAPEIYSDISPEAALMLMPYYTAQPTSRSFIGVPVFSGGVVVGVLFADSTEEDAYNAATVSFFGHFTKLISGLIQGYNEKYELLQTARTLEAVETFRTHTARYDNAPEDICTALIESVARLVPASSLGTVIFNERGNCWYLSETRGGNSSTSGFTTTSMPSGSEVYLDNSLIGKVITSGKPLHTSNIGNVIRVAPTEAKLVHGSFVAVPLVSTSRCYGALYVEDGVANDTQILSHDAHSTKAPVRYTKQDVELLQTAAEYAGTAIEQIQLKHFLHQHSLVDDATDILNKAGFFQRAQEEFTRASDVQLAFSVVLIGADNYASFATQSPQFNESVVMHIAQIARKNLRVYDIIGRYSDSIVAVGMIEKNTQESQFWSEKVRREIAGAMFSVGGKQFAVTVSIGIAEYLKQKSLPELMHSAEKAFATAREKSNAVSIFS